ncbi:hypothetical protein N0V90_008316 [Kalmusia sp. IMI 367209]|nr:hypothetical protein N0V90_008316 [Kalmusia sp. IMI 367209]
MKTEASSIFGPRLHFDVLHRRLPPIRELLGDDFDLRQTSTTSFDSSFTSSSDTLVSLPQVRTPISSHHHTQSEVEGLTCHQQVAGRSQQVIGPIDRAHHTPYPSPQSSPQLSSRKQRKPRSVRGVSAAQDEYGSEDEDAASAKAIKKYRERFNRYKQSRAYAGLYEALLAANPNLMEEGISSTGGVGLTPLKSNNIDRTLRKEGRLPLMCNKEDALYSAKSILTESEELFKTVVKGLQATGFEEDAKKLSRAVAARGTGGFAVPNLFSRSPRSRL